MGAAAGGVDHQKLHETDPLGLPVDLVARRLALQRSPVDEPAKRLFAADGLERYILAMPFNQ